MACSGTALLDTAKSNEGIGNVMDLDVTSLLFVMNIYSHESKM
jgi:hypothetical protein